MSRPMAQRPRVDCQPWKAVRGKLDRRHHSRPLQSRFRRNSDTDLAIHKEQARQPTLPS